MGTAKFLKKQKSTSVVRTFTIIGSPQYMAPEIVEGLGYDFSIDIYSIGVCFYELIAGFLPYGEDLEDPFEIYQEIVSSNEVSFPKYVKDKNAKKLIQTMLQKNPKQRLKGGYGKLKSHMFFHEFNWVHLPP